MAFRVLAIGGVRFVSFGVCARARRAARANVAYPLSSRPIQLVVSAGRGVAFARRDVDHIDHDDHDDDSLDLFVDVSNDVSNADTNTDDEYDYIGRDDYDALWHDVVDKATCSDDGEWTWDEVCEE